MRISLDGTQGKLVLERVGDKLALEAVRNHFRFEDPRKYVIQAFRDGYWDGYHYAVNGKGEFARGLAVDIWEYLKTQEIELDRPEIHPSLSSLTGSVKPDALEGITLWDHQTRIVYSLLEHGHGIADSPTGSGKTESISLLIKILEAAMPDKTIWFLVHRKGLVNQTKARLESRVPSLVGKTGALGDGKKPKENHRVILSTRQSLSSALGFRKGSKGDEMVQELWAQSGGVIIDECHQSKGDEYGNILDTLGGEVPIFGFSGTPEVPDPRNNWKIRGLCGPVVVKVSREELEEAGIIAHAVACVRTFQNLDGKIKRSPGWVPKVKPKPYSVKALEVSETEYKQKIIHISPYVEGEKEAEEDPDKESSRTIYPGYARDEIILNADRNADIIGFAEACLKIDRRVLVLCDRVAQVYWLYQCFLNRGLKCNFLFGKHTTKVRDERKAKFESGEIDVLIAGSILDEGEDIQNVGAVVLASGGAPLVRQIQRIGRGVRKKKGLKNWCPVWVSVDTRNKFERDASISRLENLDRAGVSSSEPTGAWLPFLKSLEKQFEIV